jgi:hypothetical protein
MHPHSPLLTCNGTKRLVAGYYTSNDKAEHAAAQLDEVTHHLGEQELWVELTVAISAQEATKISGMEGGDQETERLNKSKIKFLGCLEGGPLEWKIVNIA